jgi:hypothetical protein
MRDTFQEKFCRHFGVPAVRYRPELLRRTLHPLARWFRWPLRLVTRDFFAADHEFIAGVGSLKRRRDFALEAQAFLSHPDNTRFLRRTLGLRISCARMQLVFYEVWTGTASDSPEDAGDSRPRILDSPAGHPSNLFARLPRGAR